MISLLIYAILILSVFCGLAMLYGLKKQKSPPLTAGEYIKLGISGFIAFVADTLGIGSFAVNVALAKLFGTVSDEELPALNNGAQVIPGMFESLFFMQIIEVDLTTLFTLVLGTALGGLIGGFLISHLNKQTIRLIMIWCFMGIIILLLARQFQWIPNTGNIMALGGWKLWIGFSALLICGILTSAGIGLFVMVQSVLFLLGMSPLVAFPIMTTAGALQQPLTTLVFLQQNKIPLKKTLIISFFGCFGVFLTLSLFAHFTIAWLHSLLLIIVIYNLIAMTTSYRKDRPSYSKNWMANNG